jgi:PKD repeat protein
MTRHLRVWIFAVAAAAAAPSILSAEPPQSPLLCPATANLPSPSAAVLHLAAKPQPPQLAEKVRKHLAEREKYRKVWERMAPEERKKVLALFRQAVGPALQRAMAARQDPAKSALGTAGSRALVAPPMAQAPDSPSLTVSAWAYPTSGPAPLTVQFNASANDPNASATYYWDFGDGGSDTNPYATHTYTAPGTYWASVSATDDNGDVGSAFLSITVTGSGGNLPPQVSASASVVPGSLTVGFSASASDPDGYIAAFAWSFGDGTGSSEQNPSHAYGAPGSYVASVTVTDNGGATATASVSVQVTAGSSNGPDNDGDGLPDDFESQLADNFTPAYFLSLFEYPGTGLALLQDRPDAEVVTQTFPTTFPPTVTSYYRVTPLGVVNGQSYLQIDYLTLWSRDDGLALSGACFTDIDILDFFGIVPSLGTLIGGHDLDNERSSLRVVAPAVAGGFNTDANAYRVDMVYTAAHEDTLFDHGDIEPVYPPAGPEAHIAMFLSLSKHGTYLFWPHGFPLLQPWMIDATYAAVDFACYLWPDSCDLLYYIADEVIFDCITEKHVPEGWVLARPDLRTHVGEIGRSLPGGSFIQSGQLYQHLQKRFAIP